MIIESPDPHSGIPTFRTSRDDEPEVRVPSLKPGIERSVFKIVHEAAFSCQYCGEGAETFVKAFPNNTCPRCGAGAHQCDERIFVDSLPHVDQSFLVVNADDTKREVSAWITQLQGLGAQVLTLEDLLPNGLATRAIPFVLQEVAVRVPWILFVPSAQFEKKEQKYDDFILDVVFTQIIRGRSKNIVPIYLDRHHLEYTPFMVGGRMGVFLDDDSEQGVGFERSWFLGQLPRLIAEMQKPPGMK